ncbi:MAG: hypothetical protein M0Z53_05315 [Thermaerobacter sp.]|nr:hypothetical protein [Thermaerobacter sp.]
MITDQDMMGLIVDARLRDPERPLRWAQARQQPRSWGERSLVLVASDHPARRTVGAGEDAWAMANRPDLLRRLVRVLMQPFVDGALVTPDIMEELWILQAWVASQGGPDFLNDKILIGSMNRAGLAETVFELEDFVTGYTAPALIANRMDAGKLLLRIDPKAHASSRTLRYVVEALDALNAARIPAFLEPIPIPPSVDDLVRLVGVASALGPSSQGRWLKVPMMAPFARVAAATTCPLVLLGGADAGAPEDLFQRVQACLRVSPNVRGILMGRGVLYPRDGADPRAVLAHLAALLHARPVEEIVQWPHL